MINGSFRVVINKQRISSDGLVSFYVRVKIGKEKKELPLGVRWPADKFDHENGLCRHRSAPDQEADDNNMIIRTEIAKINEIFKRFRLYKDRKITLILFLNEYYNAESNSDFILFMTKKIKARLKDREIEYETYRNHIKALDKLKKHCKEHLSFSDFNENWAQKFDNFLKKNIKTNYGNNITSRWSIHKVIKTYLRQAIKENIHFTYPYSYFRIRPGKGNWKAIFEDDFKKLYDYYCGQVPLGIQARAGDINPQGGQVPLGMQGCAADITPLYRRVLRAFLFSCMTGLRISDLSRVREDWDKKGILTFLPHKGRKKNMILQVPLNKIAFQMFNDAIADHESGSLLFNDCRQQPANRILKNIAIELKMSANLHHHVGRHTFITLFYNKTKDLLAASRFAGHQSLAQTEVYTHQNPEELREKMEPMNDLFK